MVKNETHFIMRGGKAGYPSVAHDGLKLWYDTKGKKNDDKYNDTLMDMSGNGKHGELHNFSYEKLSGYQEDSELVFDGIDDKLVLGNIEEPEIISVTKNLFDPQKEIVATQGSYTLSWEVNLKPNTSYTVSTNAPRSNGVDVFFDNKDIRPSSATNGVRNTAPRTLTTDSSGVVWVSTRQTGDTGAVTNIDNVRSGEFWIQLEEGSTATPYVPYIPSIRGTYQINNNIISYDGDIARWVKDGKVIERKGVNAPRRRVRAVGNGRLTESGDTYKIEAINADSKLEFSAYTIYQNRNLYYHSLWIKTSLESCRVSVYTGIFADYTNIDRSDEWIKLEFIREARLSGDVVSGSSHTNVYFRGTPIYKGDYAMVKDVNIIDLTTAFGAGNEPTLEEIQAEPDKWQWLPNPLDLIETTELNGNILGDMEDIIDDHTRDEQSGVGVFTDKADDSLVRVEVDGKSYQHAGRGKNLHRPEKIIDDNSRVSGTGSGLARSRGDRYWYIDYMDIKPNTQYTFSVKTDEEDKDGVFYHVLDEDYEFVLGNGSGSTSVGDGHTFTTPLNSKYIRYSFQYGLEDSVQFEEGSAATEYEPPASTPDYPIEIHNLNDFDVVSSVEKLSEGQLEEYDYGVAYEGIDKINFSLSEPLRSVGDIKDRLFKDSDGLWKIERNVGEQVFDGTESWGTWFQRDNSVLFGQPSYYVDWGSTPKTNGVSVWSHIPTINVNVNEVNGATLGTNPRIRLRLLDSVIGANSDMSDDERVASLQEWIRGQYDSGTPLVSYYELENPDIEELGENIQDKLNNLRSFQGSNYVYTIVNEVDNLPTHISENLKPTIHTEFLAKDHFKESRTVNNLLIWDRPLEDDELRHQNRVHHERFNMRSETFEGEPINQTVSLLNGGMVGHSLEQNYTIKI